MSLHNLALGLGTRHPRENQNLIISASGSHSQTHTRVCWQIHAHPVDITNTLECFFMFRIRNVCNFHYRLMMTPSSSSSSQVELRWRKDMLSTPHASLARMQELYQTLWKSMSHATDNWQANQECLLSLTYLFPLYLLDDRGVLTLLGGKLGKLKQKPNRNRNWSPKQKPKQKLFTSECTQSSCLVWLSLVWFFWLVIPHWKW